MNRRGRRDAKYVRQINLRMADVYIRRLDHLAHTNNRSRRQLVETLINEAYEELLIDPTARI